MSARTRSRTAGGQTALLERERGSRDEGRLTAKVGELTMANELLREKIRLMEAGRPLEWRRTTPQAGPAGRPNYSRTRCVEQEMQGS